MPITKIISESVYNYSRIDKLHIWMRHNNMRFVSIAQKIGCSEFTARRLLNNPTAPSHRVRQLASVGIPLELLPDPLDIPPGPKPKNMNNTI